jgi:hypothetical protein
MAKTGRPTKYDSARLNARAKEYIKYAKKKGDFPTIEQLAVVLGVSVRTLYGWEAEHEEFLQTMEALRDSQRHLLLTNGLTGKYNSRFAIFLLKASHKMRENEPVVENNTNYMNINPDVLADALKLMRSKE